MSEPLSTFHIPTWFYYQRDYNLLIPPQAFDYVEPLYFDDSYINMELTKNTNEINRENNLVNAVNENFYRICSGGALIKYST